MSKKFCFMSDLHEVTSIEIEPCDYLIISGDLTYRGEWEILKSVLEYLHSLPAKNIIIIAGNHDYSLDEKHPRYNAETTNKFLRACVQYGITYLEHSSVVIDGIKFFGSPYTPKFGGWGFPILGDDYSNIWLDIPEDTDILITHGPPKYTLDKTIYGNDNVGSVSLEQRLKDIKPKVHCFGHIHESYGVLEQDGTTYVNASICGFPDYTELNEPIYLELEI